MHCPYLVCYPLIHFTGAGGSNVPVKQSRKRYFRLDASGKMIDEGVLRQRKADEARGSEKRQKKSASRRKGQSPRPNYKSMDAIEYSALRQRDWYANQ